MKSPNKKANRDLANKIYVNFYFTTGLITVLFVRFTSLKVNNKKAFYNQTLLQNIFIACLFYNVQGLVTKLKSTKKIFPNLYIITTSNITVSTKC